MVGSSPCAPSHPLKCIADGSKFNRSAPDRKHKVHNADVGVRESCAAVDSKCNNHAAADDSECKSRAANDSEHESSTAVDSECDFETSCSEAATSSIKANTHAVKVPAKVSTTAPL
jgi:hypothetical protein